MSDRNSKVITTELQLRKLKFSSNRYDVKVANVPGLIVRVGRSKVFRWDRGSNHKPRIITYGKFPGISLKQARDLHEKAKEKHSQGALEGIDIAVPKTIAELAEVFYSDRILTSRKRPEIVRQVLDHDIIPVIGTLKLSVINTPIVGRTVKTIVNRGAKSQAGRCLAILKQMFRYAVSHGFMDSNPAVSLEKADLGAGDNRRDRVLTAEEIQKFWHVLETHPNLSLQVRIGLMLLILLGIRSGELRQAQWGHLDTKAKTLTVPIANQKINPSQQKNAKPFVVPLDPFALNLFKQLHNLDDVWIFPGNFAPATKPITKRVFSKAVRRLLAKQLEIDQFTPHDLRRTMRTNLSKLKIPPHIAELCLNHSLGNIIDTYDQYSYLDERRQALEKWSQNVQVIIGKQANVTFMEAAG